MPSTPPRIHNNRHWCRLIETLEPGDSAAMISSMVHLPESLPVVLVAGGLYDEPPVTSKGFWVDTGVAPMLTRRRVEVIVHDRPSEPTSWVEEADALAATIAASGHDRVALVAGSNGCSAALRLMLDRPELVARTLLCWPATAGNVVIDGLAQIIISDIHDDATALRLLAGGPLRGVSAEELGSLTGEVVVYPSMPESQAHQRSTVTELLSLIPGVMLVGGSPEPFDDAFADFVEGFVDLVEAFSKVMHDD